MSAGFTAAELADRLRCKGHDVDTATVHLFLGEWLKRGIVRQTASLYSLTDEGHELAADLLPFGEQEQAA